MFVKHGVKTAIFAALMLSFGCGEEVAPEGHGTPVEARLFDGGGIELTPNVVLTAGQSLQVEVRFYDDHGHEIEGLEEGHYSSLQFSPSALATAAAASGRRFLFDVEVTASAGASGTVAVGYGHSPAADEATFGPFSVSVQ